MTPAPLNLRPSGAIDMLLIMPPPPRVGALSDDARLTSVCLSRTSGRSRTERPRKTTIDTEVGHVTRDSRHHFQGEKVKVQLAGGGGILWRPPAQLVIIIFIIIYTSRKCRPRGGLFSIAGSSKRSYFQFQFPSFVC